MSIRTSAIGALRFDERLPLYGWQEDIDFTSQLRASGRVVGLNTLNGVHLATKSGRISGMKFGYSQIANPVYLVRKGTMPAAIRRDDEPVAFPGLFAWIQVLIYSGGLEVRK